MRLRVEDIPSFYEDCYSPTEDGDRHAGWRELSAHGKADHVQRLARAIGAGDPCDVAEVGCGDGAVLAELGRRGFGQRLVGLEISASGAQLTAQRPEIDEAIVFDGESIDAADGAYDLVFATHVLEHVPDPAPLTREMLRVGRTVVVEVPLEANVSARRPAGRALSEAAGHLQRFDRGQMRRLVAAAGGTVRGELIDPLPLAVHTYYAGDARSRARGLAKWAIRRGLAAVPPIGERLVTMHYALIATA